MQAATKHQMFDIVSAEVTVLSLRVGQGTARSCAAEPVCILDLTALLNIADHDQPRYCTSHVDLCTVLCHTNRPAAVLIAESASQSSQSVHE